MASLAKRAIVKVLTTHLPPDSLWRDRAFVLFWWGRIISITGSVLTSVVLPILVFQLTGSALRTAMLATFQVLPYLAFGLFAGVLADRTDRRRLMVVCDVINALLLGTIPLAAAFDLLTVGHIYVVALLSATAFVWFDAANFGALPALVGRERILPANSAIWSSSTLVEIIMPAVAGLLATTLGAANTISLDALSYLLSAVALALIPRALNSQRTAPAVEGLLQRTRRDISVWGPGQIANVVERAGGVNIFADLTTEYTQVSVEEALARNPEVIVVAGYDTLPEVGDGAARAALIRTLLPTTDAVKNDRIIIIPYELINLGVSNVEAVETLARQLHPEAFQ